MAKPLFFSQSHRVLGNILEYLRHLTNTVESSQAFQCSAASSCPCRSPRGMGSSPLPPLYVSLKIWREESLMQMLRKITSFALKKKCHRHMYSPRKLFMGIYKGKIWAWRHHIHTVHTEKEGLFPSSAHQSVKARQYTSTTYLCPWVMVLGPPANPELLSST